LPTHCTPARARVRTGDPAGQTIIVVSHWFDDLKAHVK
jgi:hypothetical protein